MQETEGRVGQQISNIIKDSLACNPRTFERHHRMVFWAVVLFHWGHFCTIH